MCLKKSNFARAVRSASFSRSGIIAGIGSVVVFTVVHDIYISDIWSFFLIMMIAGALCGLCVGWSYRRMVDTPSIRSWFGYNLLYDAMLVLLGVASVLIFEPVMSMAELMVIDGPPDQLILDALPMTMFFTIVAAILISHLYPRSWKNFGTVLLTSLVIVLLLGLNISVLGLIDIPQGSFYLVAEFLGLVFMLNLVYAFVFVLLERKRFSRSVSDQLKALRLERGNR